MINTIAILAGIGFGYIVKNPSKLTKTIINVLAWMF